MIMPRSMPEHIGQEIVGIAIGMVCLVVIVAVSVWKNRK